MYIQYLETAWFCAHIPHACIWGSKLHSNMKNWHQPEIKSSKYWIEVNGLILISAQPCMSILCLVTEHHPCPDLCTVLQLRVTPRPSVLYQRVCLVRKAAV